MFKIPPVKTFDYPTKRLVCVSSLEQDRSHDYWKPLYNQFKKDIPKKHRLNSEEPRKVFTSLLREWRNMIFESEAGLVLTNFGYFFIARNIEKFITTVYNPETKEEEPAYFTGNNMRPSRMMFIPSYKRNLDLFGWSMDLNTTDANLKAVNKKTIHEGRKYKGYPYTLKQLKLI